ncbi:MAG: hypothetical protein ACOCV4_00395 [Myxococcota bacterium]
MKERSGRRRRWALGAAAVVALSVGVGAWAWHWWPLPGSAQLGEVLHGRGRVVVVGGGGLARLASGGTELVAAGDVPEVERALKGTDVEALGRALDEAGAQGLLVRQREGSRPDPDAPLRSRLRAYHHVRGLVGEYLAPLAGLYLRRESVRVAPPLDEALATVARGILEGKRPPRVRSFPEPLRRIHDVEVMVLLRDGPTPRLWRSARGSSVARALTTAASVARERWQEREQAMGGALADRLSRLTVEVSLLEEDGTLGAHDPAFLERAVTDRHGVGYERKGNWRYILPERTGSSAAETFATLFRDNGLEPEEAMGRPDIRLYRLIVHPLATSPPTK